jgi:hypothetical protein
MHDCDEFVYGQPGVYGTLGAPALGNLPGSRQGASSWTDNSGDFWLFGGWGTVSSNGGGCLNDLWVYQPVPSLQAAATPTFNPPGGNYTTAQSVTIGGATPNAVTQITVFMRRINSVNKP